MNKGIIIIGEQESGKSRLAKELVKKYNKNEIVFLRGETFDFLPFDFHSCTRETKVIVFDEIINAKLLDGLAALVTAPIAVNKQCQAIFEINPEQIIIVCGSKIKKKHLPKGLSFSRRFKIIDMNGSSL